MKKRRVFVIDDHKEDKRSMVDVPIICLDDDDDDNGGEDFKIVKNYEVFLDDLSKDDVILGYLFAVDNGESKVLKTEISRVVTLADIQRDNRAAERRKRRIVALESTKTSRIVPLRKTQQRDNKAGKCLKSETLSRADTLRKTQQRASRAGKCLELKAETLSRVETLRKTQQRANRAGKCIELKAETLRKTQQRANRAGKCLELKAGNLVRTDEDIEQDNGAVEQRKGRVVELEAAGTSRTVPFDRTEEDIERDNLAVEQNKRRVVELEPAGNSRTVPLVRIEEDIERDNLAVEQRKLRVVELEAAGTSRTVPFVRTEEDIKRDNLAVEQRKRRVVELEAAGTSRAVSLATTEEDIERDNLAVEQRKRRVVELDTAVTSKAVPLLKTQQRDNRVGKCLELKAETVSRAETLTRAVPLVRSGENIDRDNGATEQRKRRIVDLGAAGTSRAIPLVRTQEEIEGDNLAVELRKRRIVELGARRTSIAIPLVRTQEDIEGGNLAVEQRKRRVIGLDARRTSRAVYTLKTQQRDNGAGGCLELQAETLSRAIPLVRTQEDIQGDNRAAARIKRKISESKAAEICTVAHVERINRGTVVADKGYMSYIKWLVDSLKDSRNKPMVNAIKKSTIVPDKDSLVQVKVEQDVESWSDDSDLIAISDSPFMDGEDTMFVTSKKVIDLDGGNKEVESSSRCCFKKKLMDVLKKPYNEGELKQLHHDVSIHGRMTRCRELRKGREADYETNELGKSYLERFNDFENEYKAVVGVDKGKALELLRGFFFYLKNVSHDGSFKPWVKNRWWKP